jgi:hypothetical protein
MKRFFFLFSFSSLFVSAFAQPPVQQAHSPAQQTKSPAQQAQPPPQPLVVDLTRASIPIQPTMWGICFEDINLAADGGVYAELVKNRSFEFNAPLMGWKERKDHPADGSVLAGEGNGHRIKGTTTR